eukprot:CCRYP_012836-RA/>CCRYP_012836-RA protein AED:0.38 eAED:0.39 QI:0/1/0.66/1/1/1/3/44/673
MFALLARASADASTGAQIRFSAKHRSEFFAAMMDTHPSGRKLNKDQTPSFDTFANYMNGKTDKLRTLQTKIMAKAKYVSSKETKDSQERNLKNYYVNGKYNYNNRDGSDLYSQKDGADDYFVASGAWNNAFGFDATQYSFSYHRCAEVRQFDDELAAQEDSTSVFSTKHFAVFRFCPAKTCEGMTEEQIAAEREEEYKDYVKNTNAKNAQSQAAAYAQFRIGNSYKPANQYVKQQAAAAQTVGTTYEPPSWYFDRRIIGGANGLGCASNYGEYMLELEDYLDIMAEYHAERFQVYCDYCNNCMYAAYNKWINSQGRNLKAKPIDEDWKEDFENLRQRDLKDINYYAVCPEYDTCKYYSNLCKAGIDDALEEYFECTQVERKNGRIAYIGPHCSEDGKSVTLGVYSDENCNEYIGKGTNINNILGFRLDQNALAGYVTGSLARDVIPDDYYEKYWSEELQAYYNPQEQLCIPCATSMQLYEKKGNIYLQGEDDDYRNSANQYDDQVNELCLSLYLASARCDKHYLSFNTKDKNSKISNYLSRMDLSCDFIESVVMGNYDEMGFVNFDSTDNNTRARSDNFWTSNMYREEYLRYGRNRQMLGLFASMLACAILGTWALALTRTLDGATATWRPRNNDTRSSIPEFGHVMRQDSGIVRGRSSTTVQDKRISSYYTS